jgi:hypothetical protein
MMKKIKTSEATFLESCRIALENAENQSEIASEMKELNYDLVKIGEGKRLLAETRSVYDFNIQEDFETSEASANFKNAKKILLDTYMKHRKKAKIVFFDQPEILKRLQLDGSVPKTYIGWTEIAKTFYTGLSSNAALLSPLERLKIDKEQVAEALRQIEIVEKCRAEYLREKGESEDATQKKDKAIKEMERWMSEFYAVARIALEDKPQLLEALSKVVK